MSVLHDEQEHAGSAAATAPTGPQHESKFLRAARRSLLSLEKHPSISSVKTMPTPRSEVRDDENENSRLPDRNGFPLFRSDDDVYRVPDMELRRPSMNKRRCNSGDLYELRLTLKRQAEEEAEHDNPEFDFSEFRRKVIERPPVMLKRSKKTRSKPVRPRFLIPIDHPFKVLWDIATVVFSFAYVHATHAAIRDRTYDPTLFRAFCEVCFFIDILLNFVTERRTNKGEVLRDYKSICARYLTSWFAVDALSLFPWESILVKPIILVQNRRTFFQKLITRSRVILKYTPRVRGRHIRWFNRVARHTKNNGITYSRFVRLLIKYIPKYLMFFRHMKAVIAVRFLRQVNHLRRFYNNVVMEAKDMEIDNDTVSLSSSWGDELDYQRTRAESFHSCDEEEDDSPLPW